MSCVILDREAGAAAVSTNYLLLLLGTLTHSLTHSFINIPPAGRSIGQWATSQLPDSELLIVTWAVRAVVLCSVL